MLGQWEERWLNMLLDAAEKTVLDDLRKWLKRNFFFLFGPGIRFLAWKCEPVCVYFGVFTILASLFSLSLCMSVNCHHSLPKRKKKVILVLMSMLYDLQSPARIACRSSITLPVLLFVLLSAICSHSYWDLRGGNILFGSRAGRSHWDACKKPVTCNHGSKEQGHVATRIAGGTTGQGGLSSSLASSPY